jgi:hypothetical protein
MMTGVCSKGGYSLQDSQEVERQTEEDAGEKIHPSKAHLK